MCGQTNYEGAPQVPYEQRQNSVKETTARYWQVLGEWLSQSAVPPGRPSAGLIAGVIICSSYQTFSIARLLFVGTPADGTAFHLSGVWYGAIMLAVAVIGSAAVLIASSRAPLTVLGVECVLHVVGSALGMANYFVFPLLFALFSCITRSLAWIAATGILTVLVAMAASSLIVARPGTFGAEFVGQLITRPPSLPLELRPAASVRGVAQVEGFALRRPRLNITSTKEMRPSFGHALRKNCMIASAMV